MLQPTEDLSSTAKLHTLSISWSDFKALLISSEFTDADLLSYKLLYSKLISKLLSFNLACVCLCSSASHNLTNANWVSPEMRSVHRSSLRGKQSKPTSHTHTHTCTQTHSNVIDFLNTSILYGHCQMKTHSNRLEANVKWGKITSVCTRCRAQPFKVHSNVTAGKVFLCESFRVMAPKILYSLLCCTFYFHSLILFILFFRDLYIVQSTQPERRSRGPIDSMLYYYSTVFFF